jgi:hypothetical protein
MPIIVTRRGILGDLESDLSSLEKLVVDLRRIAAGDMPTPASLGDAPRLDNYRIGHRQSLCLTGDCLDHPKLDNMFITTSSLWAMSPEQGWARTHSRFYRLISPAAPMKTS